MDFLWDILHAIILFVVFLNGFAIIWIASKNSNFPFTSRRQWKSPLAIDALVFCFFISLSCLIGFWGAYDEVANEEEAFTALAVLFAIYAISCLVMALMGGTKKIRVQLNDAGHVGKTGLIKLFLGLSICSLLIRLVAAFLTMALVGGGGFLIAMIIAMVSGGSFGG